MSKLTMEDIARGPTNRAPRQIVLGTAKCGKSEYAGSVPGMVIIPVKFEEGVDNLDCAKLPVCQTFEDIISSIEFIYENAEAAGFKAAALDSSSTAQALVMQRSMQIENVDSEKKLGGGFDHVHDTAKLLWSQVQDGFDALRNKYNMPTMIIGHTKVKQFNNPAGENFDRYLWDIHEKCAMQLDRWADTTIFINTKTTVTKGDDEQNRGVDLGNAIFTRNEAWHPGGGRGLYGRLPSEISYPYGKGWQAFTQAVMDVDKEEQF